MSALYYSHNARSGAILGLIAAALTFLASAASAQITYLWSGTTTGATNQLWEDISPVLWEDLTTPADPAPDPPGDLLNFNTATDDIVIIKNTRPVNGSGNQQTEQIRLTSDAGIVDSLSIGGYKGAEDPGGTAPPAGGNWTTQFDLRGGGLLTVTNDVTLGDVDVDRARAGQLNFLPNNNSAAITIDGNILSGSTDGGNRITLRGSAGTGGLSLSGDIDSSATVGSASGTREVDLRLETDNVDRFILASGDQFLSVEDFFIGERFNNSVTGDFTLDSGNKVQAVTVRIGSTGGNSGNGAVRTASGTLTIDDSLSSVEALGAPGNGENGNLQIGFAAGNYDDTQTATGTLTVTDGRIWATNVLHLGMITGNLDATGANMAAGTLTLDAPGVIHTIGRVDGTGGNANQIAGNATVGREGTGTLNLNTGTLNVLGTVYAGGDGQGGTDRKSSGTINVASGATLLVADVDPTDPLVWTSDGTTARDQSVNVGGGNLEIGRDGTGTLNVDGGTVVVGRSSLVLGQNSGGAINGLFDGNMDGTVDDIVGIPANFDLMDGMNAFVISTNPADGDIVDNGSPDGDGARNYTLTAQGETNALPNNSRGTVNFSNGADITVGGTYSGTTSGNLDPTPNVNVNFNNGGGDMTVDASTLTVANSITMGAVGPTNARNSLTVANGSTVTTGATDGGGNDLDGTSSDVTIDGVNTVNIGDDLILNDTSELTFESNSIYVGDFGVSVADDVTLNSAELTLVDFPNAYAGDILLVDLENGGGAGVINGGFGTVTGVGAGYRLVYNFGNTGDIGLIQAVGPSAYEWLGSGTTNNLSWTGANLWNDTGNGLNPAPNSPGSQGGGDAGDTINITNTRGGAGQETVRVNSDVGTVTAITVGGGAGEVRLQSFSDNGNITIGDLTLGAGGVGGTAGQLNVNNAGSSATVTGDVIAGSDAGTNRINVGDNAAGGLTLNGVSGATNYGPDSREIDLFIAADDDTNTTRLDLGSSNAYELDELRVGTAFNGSNTATFTLNDSNAVVANLTRVANAGGNTGNTIVGNATGTLTVTNATLQNPGGNGENGNLQLGYMDSNKPEGGSSTGTVNVGASATVTANNVLSLGNVTTNAALPAGDAGDTSMPNPNATANAVLNVSDPGAVVTIGRINSSDAIGGGINTGQSRAATGTINLSDGTLNSFGRVYLGGDSQQGADRFTTGTLNLSGGTFNHGPDPNFTANGGTAGLNGELTVFGVVRATGVALGGANFEVGRDGQGFLNQSGGTLNIFRGNLVLGQNGSTNVNGGFDGNMDGTADDLVGVAQFDVRDERNEFLFSTEPADGDIMDNGTPDPDGARNYILTAQGEAAVLANVSRGTIDVTGGTLNVGATQGADPDTLMEFFNDLSYNGGGGDLTLGGTGVINVERNVNMGGVHPGQARNSLTVGGSGALNIGFGIIGNLNGQTGDITISGGSTDVDISGNFVLNGGTDLTFDFESGAVTDFNFDVSTNVALSNAELFLANTSALTSSIGDILLIDAASSTGTFSNFAESDPVPGTVYTFTYLLGGVPGKIGLVAAGGGPLGDDDADFIANLLEDAFDTDKNDKTSGREGLPMVSRSGSTITVSYRQLTSPPAGLTYTVQRSTALNAEGQPGGWTNVGLGTDTMAGGGPNSTVWEVALTSSPGTPLDHVRVLVEQN